LVRGLLAKEGRKIPARDDFRARRATPRIQVRFDRRGQRASLFLADQQSVTAARRIA
jgi:hypothetical protein